MWGATKMDKQIKVGGRFQFTHPVWGATSQRVWNITDTFVSIHAPRVGCDGELVSMASLKGPFQFTHPVWGATQGYRLTSGNH